jgi:BCD family chlorophyll transporter-like MFS transporter
VSAAHLGWLGIVRLGLVQTSLGAVVVLTTSTLNRVMVVELALPAMLPGALVALHYAVQILRPRLGHGSDVGGRRTPWIIGGMVVLAAGGVLAASATALLATALVPGVALAVAAFVLVGIGVGASGTNLLVLLARRVAPERRPAAATITWTMMIVGFIVTAGVAGAFLEPFSLARLVAVTAVVGLIACAVTVAAVWGIEGTPAPESADDAALPDAPQVRFRTALTEVWSEAQARRFTVFVFVSMLAFSAQELILEPFAGTVFDYSVKASTQLAGIQNGGVLLGMALVAFLAGRIGTLRGWTVGGCLASAVALSILAVGGLAGPAFALQPAVFALGVANGVFAVAAIGSMMNLVGAGAAGREGVRMGLWGAAQALAFGLGGFLGTAAVDATRALLADPAWAYGLVFLAEAAAFLAAAGLALWSVRAAAPSAPESSGRIAWRAAPSEVMP